MFQKKKKRNFLLLYYLKKKEKNQHNNAVSITINYLYYKKYTFSNSFNNKYYIYQMKKEKNPNIFNFQIYKAKEASEKIRTKKMKTYVRINLSFA